jgi:Rhodanese-like domain
MKNYFMAFVILYMSCNLNAQIPSKVNFDTYLKLAQEVKTHREKRLIDWKTFQEYSKQEGTIILDTRSSEMFKRKHIKGAINLNFSDFTVNNLALVFKDKNVRILIYCNNNIDKDEDFPSKIYMPKPIVHKGKSKRSDTILPEVTLALNVPTFINLYGYGYENIYELSELLSPDIIEFEGTNVEELYKTNNN